MTNMLLLQLAAVAGLHWNPQVSNTTASLRGLRVVSRRIVWASGTKGTFVRTTDGGEHWMSGTVAGAEALDFRDVETLDGETAYLLASSEGTNSRVYKTTDAGAHWELLLTNPDAKGFFDALAFWDANRAMLLGDPVDGHFVVYTTADAGKTWQRQVTPPAMDGEGAFAASGTSLVTEGSKEAWFATGGPGGARVFKTSNGGRSWSLSTVPMGGVKTAGIFSLAFVDGKHGVAVGGDYQAPEVAAHTVALTSNGGKTWKSAAGLGYRSCVAAIGKERFVAVGTTGADVSNDGGKTWQHFQDISLNAVASSGEAVWAVGPKGVIVKLAEKH